MMKTQALAGIPDGTELLLAEGASIVLERALGGRIALRDGIVWLTEPGRPGDVILRDGQRWQIGSNERVVLTAWKRSRLLIGDGDGTAGRGAVAPGAPAAMPA